MNNQEYWENRAIIKDKLLEKDINKTEKKLLKLFENVKEELLKELRVIYSDPQAFTPYQISHIDELLESVYKAIDNLYNQNEKEIMNSVGKYCSLYKVKARNLTKDHLDMAIEVRVKDEGELVNSLVELKSVVSASLVAHDGEVTF